LRAVVQRVSRARVTVGGEKVAEIGAGLCILLGVAEADGEGEAVRLADKAATALVVLFGVEARNAPAPFQTYPYTLTACPASYAHQVDPITDVFYGAATVPACSTTFASISSVAACAVGVAARRTVFRARPGRGSQPHPPA
jgi:hypothetical protein